MPDSNRSNGNPPLGQVLGLTAGYLLVSLVIGTLAFSQGMESERRSSQPKIQAEATKQLAMKACQGVEPAKVFDCIYPRVMASQSNIRAELDLDAQQGMSFWAAVMALLTAATVLVTSIGVWLVRQTLDATRLAVEETSKATSAMVRQNQIAEGAHRPWIAAECRLEEMVKSDHGIEVVFEIEFKNRGHTIAKDFSYATDFICCREDPLESIQPSFTALRENCGATNLAVIPNEIVRVRGKQFKRLIRPGISKRVGQGVFYVVIVAVAHYREEGSDNWHSTERSFMLRKDGTGPFFDRFLTDKLANSTYKDDEIVAEQYVQGTIN